VKASKQGLSLSAYLELSAFAERVQPYPLLLVQSSSRRRDVDIEYCNRSAITE
jgi:hypothetical protein